MKKEIKMNIKQRAALEVLGGVTLVVLASFSVGYIMTYFEEYFTIQNVARAVMIGLFALAVHTFYKIRVSMLEFNEKWKK